MGSLFIKSFSGTEGCSSRAGRGRGVKKGRKWKRGKETEGKRGRRRGEGKGRGEEGGRRGKDRGGEGVNHCFEHFSNVHLPGDLATSWKALLENRQGFFRECSDCSGL